MKEAQSFVWEMAKQKEGEDDVNKIQRALFSLYLGMFDIETETEPESFATFGGYDRSIVEDSMNLPENKERKSADDSFDGLDKFSNTANTAATTDDDKGKWSLQLKKASLENGGDLASSTIAFLDSGQQSILFPKDGQMKSNAPDFTDIPPLIQSMVAQYKEQTGQEKFCEYDQDTKVWAC